MKIKIRLFAICRERVGRSEVALEFPPGTSVQAVMDEMASRFPQLGARLDNLMVAVNSEYVSPDFVVHEGDEVALIPPVSGGCND